MSIHEIADPTLELPTEAIRNVVEDRDENESGVATQEHHEISFSDEELEQFKADDAAAGRAIGKILSTLFIYTAIIMLIVIWWTLKTVWNW